MNTILMSLFYGNIRPAEQNPSELPLQKYYSKEYDKLKERLDGLLNEDEQELLTELLDTKAAEDSYSDVNSFVYGFRLAASLMVEVLHDKDDLLYDREKYLRHLIHRPYVGTPSPMDR